MSVCTHSTKLNCDEMCCISCASSHQDDSSFREYLSHASFRSLHEWVGVFMYKNKWIFHEYQSYIFSVSWNHKRGRLITFCWTRDTTIVVVNVCGLLQLCHFTVDTFYRCLRCLKQHQAQLVKIPDMYLLSTLYDTIVISWFANCYRKKNDVCLICINITTYVMSQQHRCSKGIVDVSHNIVTVSACFHGFLIAFLNCKIIYLDSS